MIDTIRKQIQERLNELLSEAEKLRRALAALDPRGGSSTPSPSASPTARRCDPTAWCADSPNVAPHPTWSDQGARARSAH